ncbi:MAG: alcohol dehydrogenase catalytic domain-containing protein [Anaerolineae bacterium]|nr:alcohol dehydrogenase catalytic domain-containing protein [Anaerolineae bacterium]
MREPHTLEIVDEAPGAPGPGEVLLDIKTIGLCGSDLHTYQGHHPFVPDYPIWPGHEVAAVVNSVGAGVDEALAGKRVALEPSLVCGVCRNCRAGRYNICESLRVMGFQAPGAMGEQFVTPADRLHVLPDAMPFTVGAFVEPAAVAVHAVRLVERVAGKDIAVVGAGTIGLMVAQVVRAYNPASLVMVEISPARRAVAEAMDFEVRDGLDQHTIDIGFECVGIGAALRSAILACRKGGSVVVMGVFGEDATIPAGLIQDWEVRLLGSLMYVGADYQEAIRLLGRGDIQVDRLLTDIYPLVGVTAAFERALQRGDVLKVMLEV